MHICDQADIVWSTYDALNSAFINSSSHDHDFGHVNVF